MVLATSQQEFSDADFRVVDNGDQSKKLAFEVSGLTTATTRTLTLQDASGTVYVSGGTDIPITDGGTGASTAAGALTNLGTLAGSSGQYTPTLTNGANVAASTAAACQYLRMGDFCIVSGQFAVDPTASGTSTVITMTLPIASNIGSFVHLGGVAVSTANESWAIRGDSTNDAATITCSGTAPLDTANHNVHFIFGYRII